MDDTERRFAILEHDYPHPHLDLLLENGEAALTWRLPVDWPHGLTLNATQLPDHRLHYLTYSGPVSGNRGNVTPRDRGRIVSLILTPDEVTAHLHGIQFQGTLSLTRISADNWTATWTTQKPRP
jgi:DNA polymerase Ligase (LigD)